MNMKLFILLAVIAIIGIIVRWEYIKTEASRSFKFFRHEKQNEHYTVHTVADGLISIDGERTDAEWNSSDSISSFVNPWNTSVCPETSLWMLKDSRFLYFFFDVKDDDIVLVSEFSRKEDVGREDRAELFFSKDKDMHDYYCFEIDALGRTLAYSCSHYRKYNYGWEPPVGFLVSTRIRPDGYSVEGALPLDFIHDFIQSDGSVYMGAYRAEYSKNEGLTVENWLTWINPRTAHPDFHVPESMGKILLVNSEK
jgi:chondroitin AC lyase